MLLKGFILFLCLQMHTTEPYTPRPIMNKHHTTKHNYHKILKTTMRSVRPVTHPLTIPGPPKKIVGGSQCGVEKYPFMVSLRRLSILSHFCAGTLVRPDWIITAGHCVVNHINEPRLFTAIAGISQFNQLGIQRIRVKKMFVHPEFNENNYDNDIAMVSLEHNFVITELVKPIAIPNQVIHEELNMVCPEGISIGWGWHVDTKLKHLENGSIPHVPVMQCVVNIPILTDKQCQNARAGLHLRPNTFCTMVPTWDNLCQGDSGGPLFCDNVQYGIVSSGYTCNFADDTPGYYTRVDRVLNFIKECLSGQVSYYRIYQQEKEDVQNGSLVIKCNTFLIFSVIFSYLQVEYNI